MIGSVIGDIVGSIYEFDNIKTKNFQLFQPKMCYTDDSILTFATADWLLHGGEAADYYQKYANADPYPMGSYGSMFVQWVHKANRGIVCPYNSCGNGSAMRVGPVGWAFASEGETMDAARRSAECTHNHIEGIKGAQAVAICIYLARNGETKDCIRKYVIDKFGYDLSMPVDEIRRRYSWQGLDGCGNGGTCQDSVPQAVICALDAVDFEDAIRNAVSIGGDSDTIGCIAGSIAEALYGVSAAIYTEAMAYLPDGYAHVVCDFEARYGNNLIK